MAVRVGDKWAAFECVFDGSAPTHRMAQDAEGNDYIAETTTLRVLRLRCACGTIVTLPWKEFRGKRIHKDCGCGKAGVAGVHVIMSFSTNTGVKALVERISREEKQTASWIINTALREYFERAGLGAEDDQDNKTGWNTPV